MGRYVREKDEPLLKVSNIFINFRLWSVLIVTLVKRESHNMVVAYVMFLITSSTSMTFMSHVRGGVQPGNF